MLMIPYSPGIVLSPILHPGVVAIAGRKRDRIATTIGSDHAFMAHRDAEVTAVASSPRTRSVTRDAAARAGRRWESPFFPAEPRYFVYRRAGLR